MASGQHNRWRRLQGPETLPDRRVLSVTPGADLGGSGEGEDPIVVRQGEVAFVFGTAEDNDIDVRMSDTTHVVTIDGSAHEFDADEIRHIVISGQGGRDEAHVVGTAADDRVNIDAEEVELLSADYGVRLRRTEIVRLFGGAGFDRATIRDSAGDDSVFMHSDYTAYSNANGEIMKVSDFERVDAFSERGGFDRVSFYDSADDDRFIAREDFSYLTGSHFSNSARGFDRVDAYQRHGGNDEARLFGSAVGDTLHATPDQVVLQVGSTKLVAHDFPLTRAYGQGGRDTAEFHGGAGKTDTFGFRPGFAFQTTQGVDSVMAVIAAEGFEEAAGFGQDESDQAKLHGSADNDHYVAFPEITQLTTAAGEIGVANNFGLVSAFGNGGEDFAHLEDSPGNDRFSSKDGFAFFKGEGFINYIQGFGKIDAVSRNGGGDYGRAFDYEGPNKDHLIFDGPQFIIFGPERSERFIDFEKGRGDATDAGLSVLRPVENPFTLGGSHDNSAAATPSEAEIDRILERSEEPVGSFTIEAGRIV